MKCQMEPTSNDLLVEIKNLDKDIYDIEASLEWYTRSYQNLKNIATARDDKNNLMGYFIVTGIRDFLFEAIKEGTLSGDISFTSNAFIGEMDTNKYYASSILVLPDARKEKTAFKLLKTALKYIESCNPSGNFEMVAIVLSKRVTRFSCFYGAQLLKQVDDVFIISYKK